MLEQLLQTGLVTKRGDFFRLTVEDLEGLDRFGRKSAENLYANIQKAKRRPLERIIASLGIPQVGWTTAIELAHWLAAEVPAGDDWLGPRVGPPPSGRRPRSRSGSRRSRASGRPSPAALAAWFAPGGPGEGVLEDLADAGVEAELPDAARRRRGRAARRQDRRRHRHARGLQPRGGRGGHPRRRRQARRVGLEEDRLRRRRRGRRLEAREGPGAGCRSSTRTAARLLAGERWSRGSAMNEADEQFAERSARILSLPRPDHADGPISGTPGGPLRALCGQRVSSTRGDSGGYNRYRAPDSA